MYGSELLLDFIECDVDTFNYYSVGGFFREVCDDILGVERIGFHFIQSESGDSTEGNVKTNGISAVQFLIQSNVTLHTLNLTGELFINVFTCGDDLHADEVRECACKWFRGKEEKHVLLDRGGEKFNYRS